MENSIENYSRITNQQGTVLLDERMSKPHLELGGRCFGIVGTKTGLKDDKGDELLVGDVVNIKGIANDGEELVVEDDCNLGEYYVMGARSLSSVFERLPGGLPFAFHKIRGYETLKHGDKIDDVYFIDPALPKINTKFNRSELFDMMMTRLFGVSGNNSHNAEPDTESRAHLWLTHLGGVAFGVIGTTTAFKDDSGTPLCVGDTVEVFNPYGKSMGQEFVVEWDGSQYVMGIQACCDSDNGIIGEGWAVHKVAGYETLIGGEEYSSVRFVPARETQESAQ